MWTGLLCFGLLTVGLLCYPRRPRTTGIFMVALGILSILLQIQQGPPTLLSSVSGGFFIVMGVSYLVKYRHADVRARHVEYWTAKA